MKKLVTLTLGKLIFQALLIIWGDLLMKSWQQIIGNAPLVLA